MSDTTDPVAPEDDPTQLAADGDDVDEVAPSVDPPTEEEQLDYLAGAGWTEGGMPNG
jgi:hypothetical protein